MFSSLTFTPVVSSHAACTASLRRSRRAAVPTCALGPAAGSALATDGREVRVVVSHDGRLISQDLPSGSYTVSSWWNGAAHRKERAVESAPNCDVNHGTDCALFCTLTAPGDLVRLYKADVPRGRSQPLADSTLGSGLR